MQRSIRLTDYFRLPNTNRQPASNNKSYIEFLAKSLLDNNRTIIDWHSERTEKTEKKDRQAAHEYSLYDELVNRFLGNFSTFRSTD